LAGGLAWMVWWRCERATWATMRAGPRWLAIPTCITIAGGERAVMARAVKWAPSRALGVRVTVTKAPASSTAMAPTGAAGPIAGRHTSLTALAARCCAPAGIVPGASSARRLGAYFQFDTDVCGLRTRRRRSGSFYVHICSRSRFAQAHNRFTQGRNCRNHIDTIHIHTCVVLTFTQEQGRGASRKVK
jgi:hypothetical protein